MGRLCEVARTPRADVGTGQGSRLLDSDRCFILAKQAKGIQHDN
jgi:hypothetical protein